MQDEKYLQASDGTGRAVLAHITGNRNPGSTVIEVDNVDNWSPFFIVTTGTLGPNGYITSASICEMFAHEDSGDIIIDGFCPGYSDTGNTIGQVAIIKQTTTWADIVHNKIARLMDNAIPLGTINPFAGAAAPDHWLLCQGQAISRTTYDDLFAVVGTNYGIGDGSTTFNLPDLRGRDIVGAGTGVFTETVAQGSAINTATDEITVSAAAYKQFLRGTPVVVTSSGVAPTGLTSGNTYYVVPVGSNKIKLAVNRPATAIPYSVGYLPVDITAVGSGNLTLTLTLSARALAERGGEETHIQTHDEIGNHIHIIGVGPSAGGYPNANGVVSSGAGADVPGGQRDIANLAQNGYRGGPNGMNVMQPYLALNYIIKAEAL